ncbi:MAG: ABC transporter ATP-binding protein [Brachymonas sp.]|nr:ABC transporter ATP-binding protein [Brachymonas sp.]
MLIVENLAFSYGSTPIFSGVNFAVQKGRLCGLFGPNGSGKSTLFKCCLGLLKAGSGNVRLAGQEVSALSVGRMAQLVAYVPQDHVPPFPFLAREIVLMGRAPHFGGVFGLKKQDWQIAHDALSRLGIAHLADKVYTKLSGGQRQLVLIARALAQQTPFIMLDEPTSSLDFKNQLLIWKTLRSIVAEGTTVFACAHDPNHVLWFCDDLVVINQGTVAAAGKAQDVLNQGLLQTLYGDVCSVGQLCGQRMIYPGQMLEQMTA